ncbi:hypothetical protein Tco_0697818 [Tanacetum coccineum]
MESSDPVDTPMVEKSKLYEDTQGKAIDLTRYRGMIGTLMYLTASRPGLTFVVCMCARYQTKPTEKHLHALMQMLITRVAKILDEVHLSMQLLGDRLISWSSKRQKSAAISNTEAEYIAMSGCCAQILWMRSQLIDYGHVFNKILITMDTTRAEQIALDDALVAPANRLKIGKSNLRLSLDLKSKEATLQVVYDVLKLTPFYKAFQITADVPEIYMQEFWATAKVHHHSIRFKMNNKKHIVNLEYFRQMLQICPKLPDQQFEELPFEEEILIFLRDLGHSGEIKVITGVNVNRLHRP